MKKQTIVLVICSFVGGALIFLPVTTLQEAIGVSVGLIIYSIGLGYSISEDNKTKGV